MWHINSSLQQTIPIHPSSSLPPLASYDVRGPLRRLASSAGELRRPGARHVRAPPTVSFASRGLRRVRAPPTVGSADRELCRARAQPLAIFTARELCWSWAPPSPPSPTSSPPPVCPRRGGTRHAGSTYRGLGRGERDAKMGFMWIRTQNGSCV